MTSNDTDTKTYVCKHCGRRVMYCPDPCCHFHHAYDDGMPCYYKDCRDDLTHAEVEPGEPPPAPAPEPDQGALFRSGSIYMTRGVQELYGAHQELLDGFLGRHFRGDWGDMCAQDKHANDDAVLNGGRLMSSYHLPDGKTIWVITEADRSATTLLFPEEY